MLIQGAWRGWKCPFSNLKRRDQLEPRFTVTVGPIVVQKSACSKEYVTECVSRIWAGAGAKADMECVIRSIISAVQGTDISYLSGTQYMQKTISVAEDVRVILDIYC